MTTHEQQASPAGFEVHGSLSRGELKEIPKTNDEVLRRQMGVPSYDSQIVQILQNIAEQLLAQF